MPAYLAGQLRRIANGELVAALAEQDLRLPHFAVLAGLADFGSQPQHRLADQLGFNTSHLVGYLETLESHGLVERTRDSTDRRRQLVALTDAGDRRRLALVAVARRTERRALDALTDKQSETLLALMRRVLDHDDLHGR